MSPDPQSRHSTVRQLGLGAAALVTVGLVTTACSSSAKTTSRGAAGGPPSTTTSASSGRATIMVSDGHLTDASGRTVYLWAADTGSASTCSGACATVWPPVTVSGTPTAGAGATAADLSTIARSDGSIQLAYAGHPLYYFASDTRAGDDKGQGSESFGAKWWELDASGHDITDDSGSEPSSPGRSSSPSGQSPSGGYNY